MTRPGMNAGERRKPLHEQKTWRTNVGVCLTSELGTLLEKVLVEENRTKANYVETLIIRDLKARQA